MAEARLSMGPATVAEPSVELEDRMYFRTGDDILDRATQYIISRYGTRESLFVYKRDVGDFEAMYLLDHLRKILPYLKVEDSDAARLWRYDEVNRKRRHRRR